LIPKEKTQWNTSSARLPKSKVSTEPIMSQSLSSSPINKVMFMEQKFQNINKQMLEMTYILKLNQSLMIAPKL
jgi:hypothetical protein